MILSPDDAHAVVPAYPNRIAFFGALVDGNNIRTLVTAKTSSYPYSPECVEGELRELRTEEVPRSSRQKRCPKGTDASPQTCGAAGTGTHYRDKPSGYRCVHTAGFPGGGPRTR